MCLVFCSLAYSIIRANFECLALYGTFFVLEIVFAVMIRAVIDLVVGVKLSSPMLLLILLMVQWICQRWMGIM